MKRALLYVSAFTALILNGAIFGFFYAWVCSTMWGLDAADPAVAIRAMQAMNASVRNATFAPAFFATPVILFISAALAAHLGAGRAAFAFAAAGAIYLAGGLFLTISINVPMNEALALAQVSGDPAGDAALWQAYSAPWQFWNTVRTIASGGALLLTGAAFLLLGGQQPTRRI